MTPSQVNLFSCELPTFLETVQKFQMLTSHYVRCNMLSYSAVFIKELSWKFVNLCEISKLFRTAILKNIWRQLLLYCLYHIITSLTKVISYIQSRRFKQEGDTTESLGVFTWDPKWNLPERKFQSIIKEIFLH